MSRRSHEREAVMPTGLDRRARGKQRRAVARLGRDGVGLDLGRPLDAAQELEQRLVVTAEYLVFARVAPLDELGERGEEHREPFRRLRMAERGVELGEKRVREEP